MNKNIIVFDLDGTLSLVGDRIKYLSQTPKDWDSFYGACGEDLPNKPIIQILKAMRFSCYEIKIVTGRRQNVRCATRRWMHDNGIFVDSCNLHMRQDGDYRHDTIVKPELIKDFAERILMIFEDRKSMVDKWREMGFTCLQVAEGNF